MFRLLEQHSTFFNILQACPICKQNKDSITVLERELSFDYGKKYAPTQIPNIFSVGY
jgi:hypothetical protein